ncbi:Cas4 family exonuclease [Arthrobacter phage Thunderclap]|uniref:Cas4 family exonuclease n=1 Tax=Arthrobacter phage Thunderclap TaxID=2777309 RepID=A0A7M1RPQ2_9CAUD|nr:Cas4 family exonuclease [Arthrobacter phage Thunderclap]
MALDFRDLIIEAIKNPTDRDKQRLIGPSSMGGCPHCLALEMLGKQPKRSFSLYPMLGTAFHYYMEHHMHIEGMETEQKVDICEIEGYGKIRGTIDLWYPKWGIVGDYKLVGKNTLNKIRLDGPSKQYKYQVQIYGYGLAQRGHEVKETHILFVPRDGGNINHLVDWVEDYDEQLALAAIDRTRQIWKYVSEGGSPDDIDSDEDCYECNLQGKI